MNKNLLIILMLGLTAPLFAVDGDPQPKMPNTKIPLLQYRFSGTVGWLNRDDKVATSKEMNNFPLDRPVVLGGTFAVEFLPQERHTGLRQWNNASVGLALTVLDLGQQQYLGQVIAPHAYVNVPLVKKPHFIFGIRPGLGIGFATKTYANTVPDEYRWKAYKISDGNGEMQQIANVSIGSIANAWITAGVYMDFPIKDGWSMSFSLAWQHLSNGSVMTPNAGYNMFNAEVGAVYRPEINVRGYHYVPPIELVPHELYEGVKKKNWEVEIGLAGGCRSIYYQDRQWYGVGSFSLAAYWKPVSIFRLGGGVDVYYDGGYSAVYYNSTDKDVAYKQRTLEYLAQHPDVHTTSFGKTYSPESNIANCFRVGISLQPEMVLGNLTFGYHLGIYLYDPVKNMEPFDAAKKGLNRGIIYAYDPSKASTYQDGWFYQKLQLKYLCSKHLYVQMGLKLHIMKAEFIDAGLGIRI